MIRSEADGSTDVQLLDFGVAAVHPAYGEATEVPRRPEDALHIAPEVLKGLKGDSRSDVYALAVLLYRAVTGDVPFVGDDFETIVEKVQNEGPRLPKSVAAVRPELEAVILRGLVKDPQKRTPSVQALLSALDPIAATTGRHRALSRVSTQEQLLVSDPSQSEPATAPTALKVPKKRMWMLLGLVVAVLLFGGALAWTLLGGEEEVKTTPRPRPKRVAKRVTRTTPRAARPAPIPKRKAAPKPPVRTVQRKGASAPKEQAAPAAPAPRPKVLARPMGSRARALRRVAARLTQAYGTVKVLTGHPRAKILFDGKVVGQGKLHTLRRVPTGKHTLQAEIDGQKGRTKTIDVKAGATLDVTL